ncbi:METTL5 family protein [Caldivirga maquilingensis]|uniref:Putative RNA methylase n=1 Tax=Caldivirga maquilingensis (strain ATCC 700844 / DSM 13496 / JCM 10307 / IC-167) TaxID=397948 RepID=A8MCB2_CALMQ|nr:METTL5 family protein [Caldivirga maquilingensis]ABW01418.1 putative RNA methylase [Caldivirga maquilingensis IC-167]
MLKGSYIRGKRELEAIIQGIGGYSRPKLKLEQYVTDADVVAEVAWLAYLKGDVAGRRVIDPVCGTGRFSAAAALLGSTQVVCSDIDEDAVRDAYRYLSELSLLNTVDFAVMDFTRPALAKPLDTVFQNPPFGIWSPRGTDIKLLMASLNLSKVTYSIHKEGTEDYVIKVVKSLGRSIEVARGFRLSIPYTYRHHRKPRRVIEVYVIRVT